MSLDRNWVVYILKCSDGSLYCGATNNLKKRIKAHNTGSGAKYTRSRRPVEELARSVYMTQGEALHWEYEVKRQKTKNKVRFLSSLKI